MKKKILMTIGVAFFATLVFSALPASAQAAVSWNDNALKSLGPNVGNDCPTVAVYNTTTSQNLGVECFGPSINASAGDTVKVRVYYHNTGTTDSTNTRIAVNVPTGSSTVHTITGSVSGGGASASGSATISLSSAQRLTFVSAVDYKNGSNTPISISGTPSTGFNVGTVRGWTSCPTSNVFCEQGGLILAFRVENTQPPQAQCAITSFSANPQTVASGSSSTITWNTTGCTSVSVSGPGVQSGQLNGSANTGALYNSATYTITASGTNTVTQNATVSVSSAPTSICAITSFNATPLQVTSGGQTTVSWATNNCTSVSVSGPGLTSGNINGSQTTGALYNSATYTITASNATNTTSQNLTVTVSAAAQCAITSFSANPQTVQQGGTSYISWATTGCTNVSVSGPDITSSLHSGSQPTGPIYGSRTYTITASGTNTVTQNLTVSAYQTPINSYACQDGYDNDGDGYVDYPQDPGCSSSYDNDEYNQIIQNNPPTVTTTAATNVGEFQATLNGYLSQGTNCTFECGGANNPTTYYFQYGTNPNALNRQTNSQALNNYYGSNVSAYVSGLQSNTTYYFRLVGSNNYGTRYGTTLSFVTPGNQNQELSVITTLATNITSSSARLNGLVTGANVGTVQAYFEYGTNPSLGFTTTNQNISTNTLQNYFDTIATSANTTYYYRAVAVANGVTYRGSTVSFRTPGVVVNTNTNTNTTNTTTTTNTNTSTFVAYGSGGGSPLVMLAINDGFQGGTLSTVGFQNGFQTLGFTNQYQNVIPGELITYSIHYKNISTATLSNVVLNVILPHDVSFRQSTAGVLTTDNTVAAPIGTLTSGQEGVVVIQGIVSPTANPGTNLVATATLAFTTPSFGQDSAVAYALNTVGVRNSLAGLALFGAGFFPTTFFGWVLLLGLILIIILIARYFYYERRNNTVTIHNNSPKF